MAHRDLTLRFVELRKVYQKNNKPLTLGRLGDYFSNVTTHLSLPQQQQQQRQQGQVSSNLKYTRLELKNNNKKKKKKKNKNNKNNNNNNSNSNSNNKNKNLHNIQQHELIHWGETDDDDDDEDNDDDNNNNNNNTDDDSQLLLNGNNTIEHNNNNNNNKDIIDKNNNEDDEDEDEDEDDDDNSNERENMWVVNVNDNREGEEEEEERENGEKIPPLLRNHQTDPVWIQLLKLIDINLREIQKQLGLLRKYHRDRLKITFDDDLYSEQDMKIEETTRSLTALFRDTDVKLKEIAYKQKTSLEMDVGNDNISKLSYEERVLRYNAMRSRATRIQELTKVFRRDQRLFLEKLQSHESKGGKFIDNGVAQTLPSLDKIEQGFTKAQLQQLETIERSCNDRTREIIHIAKSVNELSQLFKELSILVVEQGSILDRIDYNVEQTVQHLQASHTHVKKAESYQKQSCTTIIVMILMALILVSLVILVLKNL